jgi:hypothetical protein
MKPSTTPRRRQLYIADPNPLERHRTSIRSSIDGWPVRSAGDKHLLLMTPTSDSLRTLNRLEMYMGSVKGNSETPLSTVQLSVIRRRNDVARSAIKAYKNDIDWADGLEATLMNRSGQDDVTVVCRTSDELERVKHLLSAIYAQHEDDYDLFGLGLPQAPVFLVDDIAIQQCRELFVAPGISPATTPRGLLETVLHVPRTGLHIVA